MEITDVLIVGVIVSLTEVLKFLGASPKQAAISSLILGIIAGVVFIYPGDIKMGIFIGLIMGLTASGFYSQTKTFVEDSEEHLQEGDKDGQN